MQDVELSKLVAPTAPGADSAIGKNIAPNQPDVEALAMISRDFPLTEAKFDEMRGQREWVSLQIVLVKIGSAGFSKVPYLSSKKKGEKDDNPQAVYEDGSSGTRFFSYNKGKTNKDRGARVESVDEAGVEIPTTATLQPGVCLSAFMRAEAFAGDSRFFVNRVGGDVLSKFTFVYVQLASQNVEQAKKGNLIKIKRMRIIEDQVAAVGPHVSVSGVLSHLGFPQTISAFEKRMEEAGDTPAIAKQVYQGDYKYCAIVPHEEAYITAEEDGGFLCSESQIEDRGAIYITKDALLRATNTSDASRACKIASMAIAMGALSMMIADAKNEDVVVRGGKPHTAVMVYIDTNVFLSKQFLANKQLPPDHQHRDEFHIEDDDISVSLVDGLLMWSPRDKRVMVQGGQRKRIVFSLSTAPVEAKKDPWTVDYPLRLMCDGAPGEHHRLTIHFAEVYAEWKHICSLVPPVVKPGISIQIFPSNATASHCAKRKSLEAIDSRDDFGDLAVSRAGWAPKRACIGGGVGYSHDDNSASGEEGLVEGPEAHGGPYPEETAVGTD